MWGMTDIAPTAKPKRFTRSYTPQQRTEVLELYASGINQPAIALKLGIPQQTCATWLQAAQASKPKAKDIANRVKQSISKAVSKLTAKATSQASAEVQKLLDDSLSFGRIALVQAHNAALACNGRKHVQSLVAATNAAKNAVSMSRQALGLNDTSESVIVRVDLVGRIDQPVIDVTPTCGVSEHPLTLTPTPSNTTSDNHQ